MRRGPTQIPVGNAIRTIEFMEGGPGYENLERQVTRIVRLQNLFSYLLRPYHFSSIGEFQDHQRHLRPGSSMVAFDHPLLVTDAERNELSRTQGVLNLRLKDETGEMCLDYPHPIEHLPEEGFPDLPDIWNDPLHGVQRGDRLQIHRSTFQEIGVIRVEANFHVRNDDHYNRIAQMRADLRTD